MMCYSLPQSPLTPMQQQREAAADHLRAMMKQESPHYAIGCDYLSNNNNKAPKSPTQSTNGLVSEGWRRHICEWFYEVVDHFGLDREAVSIALNYIDRFLSQLLAFTGEVATIKRFQLVAITCLYLALKLHGQNEKGSTEHVKLNHFVQLSRGLFHGAAIEGMEYEILKTLEWRVNPPMAVCFLRSLLHLLPERSIKVINAYSIFETARYLIELTSFSSEFSFRFKQSVLAYASILCSIEVTPAVTMEARKEFLDAIASTTVLSSEMDHVQQARSMIIDIWPEDKLGQFDSFVSIAADRTAINQDTNSKSSSSSVSPVSVRDERQ